MPDRSGVPNVCSDNPEIYNRTCVRCVARYVLSQPTRESENATRERWCRLYGHNRVEVARVEGELKRERPWK